MNKHDLIQNRQPGRSRGKGQMQQVREKTGVGALGEGRSTRSLHENPVAKPTTLKRTEEKKRGKERGKGRGPFSFPVTTQSHSTWTPLESGTQINLSCPTLFLSGALVTVTHSTGTLDNEHLHPMTGRPLIQVKARPASVWSNFCSASSALPGLLLPTPTCPGSAVVEQHQAGRHLSHYQWKGLPAAL